MMKLETERLILDKWRRRDAADLYAYAKNPAVGPPAGWQPHTDIKESRKLIRRLFQPNGVWAIRLKDSGKAIGTIGLEEDKHRTGINSKELGYSLSEDYWGRGLMTEAARAVIKYGFDTMKLGMICISTGPENQRSQSVIRKCRFTYEGTLRRAYKIYDGTVRDVQCYSLLKEEYYGD